MQRAEPPSFLKRIGDCEVYRGMPAKFTACVTGNPEPDFEWYRNGDRIWQTDRIRTEQEGSLLRLTIANVDELDAGKYTLRIVNPHGEDSCSAELIYECKYTDGLDGFNLDLPDTTFIYNFNSSGATREEGTGRPIRRLRQISQIWRSITLSRPSDHQQDDGSSFNALLEAVHSHRSSYPCYVPSRDVRATRWRLVHRSYRNS